MPDMEEPTIPASENRQPIIVAGTKRRPRHFTFSRAHIDWSDKNDRERRRRKQLERERSVLLDQERAHVVMERIMAQLGAA